LENADDLMKAHPRPKQKARPDKAHPFPKKKFGQHFLHNPQTIERILGFLHLSPKDRILEIGPGPGTLTLPLCRLCPEVVAVEIDPHMVAHLNKLTFTFPPRLVEGDFLQLYRDDWFSGPFKIVGNLPYNVSVPILMRLLSVAAPWTDMVLMFQKEVGDRINARPGTKDYGIISVLAQARCHLQTVMTLAPGAFQPPPKVDSLVLHVTPASEPLVTVASMPGFHRFLKPFFQHRRKSLGHLLKHQERAVQTAAEQLMTQQILYPNQRPDAIDVVSYARFFNLVSESEP
jgi:16S rRNA (adenine1518-N6/adenine1519-N6)-dimethyltransferase